MEASTDRPDPLEILSRSNANRLPELVPVRNGRMKASSFAFYRGSPAIMAADLSRTPSTGIELQICGDAHLLRGVFEGLRIHRMETVAKDAEILVLRHQLAVLHRQAPRPRFTWSDRALVAALVKLIPQERWGLFLVTPETILRWQRALMRRRWTYSHRRPRPARLGPRDRRADRAAGEREPPVGLLPDRRRAQEARGQATRTSVGNVLRRHGLPPAPRREVRPGGVSLCPGQGIVATDFLHVDTVFLRRYYVLFVIEIERRVVHVLGTTANPNQAWVTQVARNFTTALENAGRRFRFLIRDRDTKFTRSFDVVFASIGVETIRTPVRSPRVQRIHGAVGANRPSRMP